MSFICVAWRYSCAFCSAGADLFAAQPAKNSAVIAAKTKFFIFSPLVKCLGILSNLSFINRVKFERAAKWVKFKDRGKFDSGLYTFDYL